MSDIEQRVKEIIVNQLNVNEEQITPEASFIDDLGADSLDTVELIMAFEEEFKDQMGGKEIPESDAEKLTTSLSPSRSIIFFQPTRLQHFTIVNGSFFFGAVRPART